MQKLFPGSSAKKVRSPFLENQLWTVASPTISEVSRRTLRHQVDRSREASMFLDQMRSTYIKRVPSPQAIGS